VRRIERRVEIGVPPEQVFAFVADPSNISRWQTGVQSVERTSQGPLAQGERIVIVREAIGQRVRAELDVRELDPSRRCILGGVVGGVDVETAFEAAPADDGGSLLTLTITLRAPGLIAFLEPMMAAAAEADLDQSIGLLRAHFGSD